MKNTKLNSLIAAAAIAMSASASAIEAAPSAAQERPRSRVKPLPRKVRNASTRRNRSTLFTKTNGERECARRRRQIAAGTLQVCA